MSAKTSIRKLLEAGEFVWAPCIYDCVSARVAEMVGHNACLISSCELEYAMNGIPAGLYNWEEYIWATERICNSTTLPVIVDGENGGGTPMQVYRNCKRLAEAGAMAISIEDTLSGGFMVDYNYGHGRGYMERELWATNVKAAVDAVRGTDCMIIARTDCKGGGASQTGVIADNPFSLGLDEAIRRAKMGVEAGAEITMIQNICHAGCEEECRRIAKEVPGYHFYPDVHATDYAALERARREEEERLSRERRLQEAMLSVKKKFGKNAILKGMNLQEGATTMERHRQIGGHKA